jgi:hypothetical protein
MVQLIYLPRNGSYALSMGPRGPMRILYIEVLVYSHIFLWVPRGACGLWVPGGAYGLWVPGGAYGLWVPRCADEQLHAHE